MSSAVSTNTQPRFSTLVEALDNNASDAHAISYLGSNNAQSSVNFNDLRSRALGILFNLQKRQVKPGQQLIIHTNNNELFLDAFWAGLYGGIIPVPVAIAINDEHRFKLLRIFNKLEAPWLYTDSETLDKILAFCESNNLSDDASRLRSRAILIDEIDDVSQLGKPHPVLPSDVAFIQFSSGSTSTPKGVVLTHKNLMTNIYAIIAGAEFTQADKFFGWMPLTHDLGMIGYHLTPVVLNIDHTIMETNVFVRRPLLWLIAASEQQATILCSPNFGYKHFLKVYETKGIEQIDLSHVRLVINGAEPISAELCNRFLSAMASYGLKANSMFPVYGLAEASLAVSFPNPGDEMESIKLHREHLAIGDFVETCSDPEQAIEFVLTGKPINDCLVRITDENNKSVANNTVGKIQLKGDNVTSGYYLEDKLNQKIISADGWLDTGDLGAFVEHHLIKSNSSDVNTAVSQPMSPQLIITGRIKDIIFVNGLNYYSHDLENILHTLDGLELGKVIATGARKAGANEDEVIIFILHRGSIDSFIPLAKAVRKKINETTGIEIHQVIPVIRIPKTTSGKVQRHHLNSEYISGNYDKLITEMNTAINIASNTSNSTEQDVDALDNQILEICNSTVEEKSIALDDNLFEIGISSLALAEIHEAIDETFPDKVEIADLFDNPTVRELSAFLKKAIS